MLNKPNISPDNQKLIVYVFLTLLTLAVFWQANHYDFVNLDDDIYVTENSRIISGFTLDGLRWAFTTTIGQYWHPVTWLSLMLDYKLFGLNAGGYHATNVLLHLLSALLLFMLFSRMTGEIWKSAFVAALFALHPLDVESVAWVAKRRDLLCVLFTIITLYLYLSYTEKPVIKKYLAALLCFALALASKPMMVTLPVIMILLDYWPLKRFGLQKGNQVLWQIKEKTPFFAISAVFSVITIYARDFSVLRPFSFSSRLSNSLVSFVTYLEKMFWPYDLSVSQLFPDNFPLWQVWGSAILIIVVTAAVIAKARHLPYLFAGWLWYATAIIPTLGIIQYGNLSMSDHHTYFPSIGISIMLAWGIPLLFPNEDTRRKILFPAGAAAAALFAVLAWQQCGYWRNSIELFSHTLKVTKDNHTAHYRIADAYAGKGRIDESLFHYKEAIRINPSYARAYNSRGNFYSKMGIYESAIKDYNETVRLKPKHADAYSNRGNAYTGMGRYDQAIEDYNKAIQIKPDHVDAYNNRGIAYTRTGRYQNAIGDFNEAVRIEQTLASPYNNRGIVYVKLGQYNKAVDDFSKAISLKENRFEVYFNRGSAYFYLGRYDRAIADFNKAIALNPGKAEVYKSLGIIYFKQGDNQSGCLAAQKACTSGDCNILESARSKGYCR